MSPQARKLALIAHVTGSVGWLGAVAAFLALSIAGLTSHNAELVRGAYLAMDLIGWYVIVPLGLVALTTGLVQSLGTEWGVLRHYWVVIKFILTVVAMILLLLHQFTAVREAAHRVTTTTIGTVPRTAVGSLAVQLVVDASLAILVLLAATILSVYKPWGWTPYGRRVQAMRRGQPVNSAPTPDPEVARLDVGMKVTLTVIGIIIAAFVVRHLASGGLGHHSH